MTPNSIPEAVWFGLHLGVMSSALSLALVSLVLRNRSLALASLGLSVSALLLMIVTAITFN